MTKDLCPCCPTAANVNNFGGLCDPCEDARQARTEKARRILRENGQEDTDYGRAIGA